MSFEAMMFRDKCLMRVSEKLLYFKARHGNKMGFCLYSGGVVGQTVKILIHRHSSVKHTIP